MFITPSRANYIRNHFVEYSSEDEELQPDYPAFQTLTSAEQYYLASIYNWDEGTEVLTWIIDSPKCDKGTAIMIFWMAEPDYYFDYTIDSIDDWAKDVFVLLQRILERYRNNSYKQSLFGYKPSFRGHKTNWPSAKGIWELPAELRKGRYGLRPISLG